MVDDGELLLIYLGSCFNRSCFGRWVIFISEINIVFGIRYVVINVVNVFYLIYNIREN